MAPSSSSLLLPVPHRPLPTDGEAPVHPEERERMNRVGGGGTGRTVRAPAKTTWVLSATMAPDVLWNFRAGSSSFLPLDLVFLFCKMG